MHLFLAAAFAECESHARYTLLGGSTKASVHSTDLSFLSVVVYIIGSTGWCAGMVS